MKREAVEEKWRKRTQRRHSSWRPARTKKDYKDDEEWGRSMDNLTSIYKLYMHPASMPNEARALNDDVLALSSALIPWTVTRVMKISLKIRLTPAQGI